MTMPWEAIGSLSVVQAVICRESRLSASSPAAATLCNNPHKTYRTLAILSSHLEILTARQPDLAHAKPQMLWGEGVSSGLEARTIRLLLSPACVKDLRAYVKLLSYLA